MLKQYKRQLVFANQLQTMIKLPFNLGLFKFFHILKIRNLTCLTIDHTRNLTIGILRDSNMEQLGFRSVKSHRIKGKAPESQL